MKSAMDEIPLERFTEKRPDARSLMVVASHVALVLAPVYLAVLCELGSSLFLLWLWFGFGMNGLLNLMHECAHYHVFKSRNGSDILGGWLLAPLAFADFQGYRRRHWQHHRRLGTTEDTKDAYLISIRGLSLFWLLIRCLLLVEAWKKFSHQLPKDATVKNDKESQAWAVRVLLVQALFFGSIFGFAWTMFQDVSVAATVSTKAYLTIYLYGLVSLTVFAATLRAIAEHQVGVGAISFFGHAALRNFRCNPITRLFFGAYGFAQHATHHQWPSVPYYHLPKLTSQFPVDQGSPAATEGYLKTLFLLLTRSRN